MSAVITAAQNYAAAITNKHRAEDVKRAHDALLAAVHTHNVEQAAYAWIGMEDANGVQTIQNN